MSEEGVVHDFVWDDVLGRVMHLELRCLECETSGGDTTRVWMTRRLLEETLGLLSVVVNRRAAEDNVDLTGQQSDARPCKSKPTTTKVDIMENENVRVACTFRSDPWATNRPKLSFGRGKKFERHFLSCEKIVASVALLHGSSSKGDVLNKTLYREVGASQDREEPPSNIISKYFQSVTSDNQ